MSRGLGVFIQVRLASTRLPGKALLPLEDRTVIGHVMRALKKLPAEAFVLLTDHGSAARLEGEARRYGYDLFTGDPDDVLHRYCRAIERYRPETVLRATGDNPLTSVEAARLALELFQSTGADYAGITGTPYGTGVEIVRSAALLDVETYTNDPYDREHVTPGIYRRDDRYSVRLAPAPDHLSMPDLRVTLDTPTDYDYISGIYGEMYTGSPIEIPQLIEYGRRHHQNSA